jgi:hypothetical protein
VSDGTTAPAAAPRAAPAKLSPITEPDRKEMYKELVYRYCGMRPTHAPRENTAETSQLSPTYRACAWAMDALKSAEEIWRRELEWRAQQQGPDAQIGGGRDDAFPA